MAMIESYRIGVELVLGGDLAAGIEALIPSLARLDESLVHANADAKTLAAGLEAVAAASPGLDRTADAMGRLNAAMASMNRTIEHSRASGGESGFAVPGERALGSAGASVDRRMRPGDGVAKDAGAVSPAVPPEGGLSAAGGAGRRATGLPIDAILATATAASTSASRAAVAPGVVQAVAERKPPMADGAAGLAIVLAAIQGQPSFAGASLDGGGVDGRVAGRDGAGALAAGSIVTRRNPADAVFAFETVLPMVAGRQPTASAPRAGKETDLPRKTEALAQRSLEAVSDIVLPRPSSGGRAGQPGFDPWRALEPVVREGAGGASSASVSATGQSAGGRVWQTGSGTTAPIRMPVAVAGVTPEPRVGGVLSTLADWLGTSQGERTRDHAGVVTPGLLPVRMAPRSTAPVMSASRDGMSALTGGLLALKHAANRLPVVLHDGIGGLPRPLSQVLAEGGRRPNATPPGTAAHRAMETGRTAAGDGLGALQSYHKQGEPGGAVIQHVTYVQLDERTIARAVTRQQLRMMGGQVSGTLRPDPSIAPQYGAHLLEN